MTEFEKWNNKDCGTRACGECQAGCDMLRQVGWKAAFINIQQWLMGRRCTGEDVLDYVNKELQNECY